MVASPVTAALHYLWFTLVFGVSLVVFVLCAFGLVDLFENDRHFLVQKRTPKLTALFVAAMFTFVFGSEFPRFLLAAIGGFDAELVPYNTVKHVVEHNHGDHVVVRWIALELGILSVNLTIVTVCAKLWLTYFDLKWNYHIADNEWVSIISTKHSNTASEKRSRFFIKYKRTLGSAHHVCFVLLPIAIVFLCGVDHLLLLAASAWFGKWTPMKSITAVIFLVFLLYDTPRVADTLYVWLETKWWIGLGFLVSLFSFLANVVPNSIATGHKQTVNWPYIYTMSALLVFFCLAMVCLLVFFPLNLLFEWSLDFEENTDDTGTRVRNGSSMSTVESVEIKLSQPTLFALELWTKFAAWVKLKCSFGKAKRRAQLLPMISTTVSSKASEQGSDLCESEKIKEAAKRGIKGVLSDRNSLSVFMQHLTSEFCAESLLALVEFVQFIGRFQGEAPSEKWMVVLREEVAQSDIVFNNDVYGAIRELYARYVANGAEYEINVSFGCRDRITQLVESDDFANGNVADESTLQSVFGGALAQVLNVMRDSFLRWRLTEHFRRYALSVDEIRV